MAFISDEINERQEQEGQSGTHSASSCLVLFMVDAPHAGGTSQCFITI